MGCTRQVIRSVAIQQSDAMRAKFMAEVSIYDPSMFLGVIDAIRSENIAIASEEFAQLTTDFLSEELGTLPYPLCPYLAYMIST